MPKRKRPVDVLSTKIDLSLLEKIVLDVVNIAIDMDINLDIETIFFLVNLDANQDIPEGFSKNQLIRILKKLVDTNKIANQITVQIINQAYNDLLSVRQTPPMNITPSTLPEDLKPAPEPTPPVEPLTRRTRWFVEKEETYGSRQNPLQQQRDIYSQRSPLPSSSHMPPTSQALPPRYARSFFPSLDRQRQYRRHLQESNLQSSIQRHSREAICLIKLIQLNSISNREFVSTSQRQTQLKVLYYLEASLRSFNTTLTEINQNLSLINSQSQPSSIQPRLGLQ